MTYIRKNNIIAILVMCLLGATSCSDWDNHYEGEGDETSVVSSTIYDVLKNDEQTSLFAEIAAQVGYDKVLSASQTYTVFAPTNDALTGFDLTDEDACKRLMQNHIARYVLPTSTATTNSVRMLNNKMYYFDNASSFSGAQILAGNIRANNGIIHKIDGQVPFSYNIYEFIANNANTSKLYDFINQFNEERFDVDNSIEIGIDEHGRPVYDSLIVKYNRLLEDKRYGIGSISNEDSIMSMIIPSNAAWDAAYARIFPSFKIYHQDAAYADSVQDVRTKLAIVNDLIFRGSYPTPATEDSLISTTGSIIHNTSTLFGNAQTSKVSNGYSYVVNQLNYDNTETWDKPLDVEGEDQKGRKYNDITTVVYTRNTTDESLVEDVSSDRYIEVFSKSTTRNPEIDFEIPNVLAGTYNVYVVLLPSSVEGEKVEADSTRLEFTLNYQNANGGTSKLSTPSREKLISKGHEVTKMLAFKEVNFPVSNCTDNIWRMEEGNDEGNLTTTTKLTIATKVSTREFTNGTYARTFRLDRIILEPTSK